MTAVIEYEISGGARGPDGDPSPADPRDFPNLSPNSYGDLSFTTSQYGLFIPIVFGSDKLNGNVFWASPIQEHIIPDPRNPGQEVFYRTINFALGICEGEINGVLRMWMGDKLILDNTANINASGIMQPNNDGFILGGTVDITDADSPLRNLAADVRTTKVSVFSGSETQLPEGVIVAEEGYENVPGYRGLAFVLFENFVLGSGGSIPNMFVEVTSNTQNLFPRLYGNLATPTNIFTSVFERSLNLDPSYDHLIVPGRNATTARGLALFSNNNLVEQSQKELEVLHATRPLQFERLQILSSGFVAIPANDGNPGYVYVFNPLTGDLLSTLGPGGGVSGHSMTTGLSDMQDTGTVSVPGLGGLPTDVFWGIGSVNTSIGFAAIDQQGQIAMASILNNVFPHPTVKSVRMVCDSTFAPKTFVDTKASEGAHVMTVSSLSGETVEFHVSRITVDGPGGSLKIPTYTEIGQISCGDMGGTGFIHNLLQVLVDPIDNCLVLLVNVANGGRQDRILKWSPFTGQTVWSVAVPERFYGGARQAGPGCLLLTQKYVWISSGGLTIYEVDLKTGVVREVVANLVSQNLPSASSLHQFYNGYEDSIAYYSATANQNVVKTYLNRITRSTVELGDIVTILLKRVGLLNSDIIKTDLQALTLNGYTITKQQSLRTCFAELGQAFKYDVIESNGRIKYKTRGATAAAVVPTKHLGDVNAEGWLEVRKQNDISRIRKINLTYRDIDREYANNVQSVILPRYGSQSFDNDAAIDVTVPIVLAASTAKGLAEILLYSKLVYDSQYAGELPGYYENLDPGDVVTLQLNDTGTDTIDVRLRQVDIGPDHRVKFEASEEDRDIYINQVNLFGSIGRFEKAEFPSVAARIDPYIMMIPYRDPSTAAIPQNKYTLFFTLLNLKSSAVLPSSAVTVVLDGAERINVDPPLTFPTWGFVTKPADATRSKYAKDTKSVMRVRLMSTAGAVIQSAVSYSAMLDDSKVNLAYVGGELIQFETAVNEGNGIWRLEGLHRGKFGTDMFVNSQTAGDRFVLLSGNDGIPHPSIVSAEVNFGTSPRRVAQVFVPSNNPFQPIPISFYTALNFRQWTVADIRASYSGNDAVITWQRRTRYNGEYGDDGPEAVPLNEAAESYDVYLYKNPDTFFPQNASTYMRKVSVTSPTFTYTAAMQTADGFDNLTNSLYIMINQTGSLTNIDVGAAEQAHLPQK